MNITLEWFELKLAAGVGVRRKTEAIAKNMKHTYGLTDEDEDTWGFGIEGAAAEMAFAKATNRYWNGSVNTFKNGGDVGHIQVRSAPGDNHCLVFRPDDREEDIFVLVLGRAPKYRVVGWQYGQECKRQEWFKTFNPNRPKVYFVPQSHLRPIEDLNYELSLK